MRQLFSPYFTLYENLVLLTGSLLKWMISRIPGYNHLFYTKQLISKFQQTSFSVSRRNHYYFITNNNNPLKRTFQIRSKGSDLLVFQQVIVSEEYAPLFNMAHKYDKQIKTIIDIGANIGLTAIYLNLKFPGSTVYAIEPEDGNYKMLLKNLQLNEPLNIIPVNTAIWYKNEFLTNSSNFRDKLSWANQTLPSERNKGIRGVTMDSFITDRNISKIDILKIDIEGTEKQLFKDYAKINEILAITEMIALEVHDEVADREFIYQMLGNNGFYVIDSGETTFAYKK